MPPPDYPGIPSKRTPTLGTHERRPSFSNPPPAPVLPPRAIVISEAPETGRVAVTHGKWRLSMTPTAALVVFACVACAAVGYFASAARHPVAEDASLLIRDVRERMAEQKQAQADAQRALLDKFENLQTQVSRLQDSQDRLRERFNEAQASRHQP